MRENKKRESGKMRVPHPSRFCDGWESNLLHHRVLCQITTLRVKEELATEGGGGFNPRMMPAKLARALALDGSSG